MANTPLVWNGLDAQGNPLRWNTPGLVWGGSAPPPPHKMHQLRVLLGFTNASDHSLEETGGSVSGMLYSHAAYPTPPVTKVALDAARTAFTTAIATQMQGGTMATAEKNNARDALVGLLRQLAGYVQTRHNNDMATLLSSGFEAVSSNRAQHALEKPLIQGLDNGNSGQLLVRVKALRNVKSWEARYAALASNGAPGALQAGGLFTNSRSIVLNTLTPGTNYRVEVRAVGGATGYSDWSDAVSHMSM